MGLLPQISKLDGRSIYELGIEFTNQGQRSIIPPTWGQSDAPAARDAYGNKQVPASNLTSSFHGIKGLANYDHQPVVQQITSSADMNRQLQYEGYRGKLEDNFNHL